jgi:hypothetical protein
MVQVPYHTFISSLILLVKSLSAAVWRVAVLIGVVIVDILSVMILATE